MAKFEIGTAIKKESENPYLIVYDNLKKELSIN